MASSDTKFTFAGGEIVVTIPASITPPLRAVSLPLGEASMSPSGGFQPLRLVANIAIEEVGKPGVYLTELPARVHFKVKYRAADAQAAGGKPLRLAFWDGSSWVPLTAAKHSLKMTAYANPNNGGYGSFSLKKWGDPPIGWGT